MELCGKIVKPTCYKNAINEIVDYELVGNRGAVWQVIRHTGQKNYFFIRNGKGNICALAGNYILTNKDGFLNIFR